jgi:hypothetical protein
VSVVEKLPFPKNQRFRKYDIQNGGDRVSPVSFCVVLGTRFDSKDLLFRGLPSSTLGGPPFKCAPVAGNDGADRPNSQKGHFHPADTPFET